MQRPSGYDHLARGIAGMDELGMDDPRVHKALRKAIDSGDLTDEDAAVACSALGSCFHGTGRQKEAIAVFEQGLKLSKRPDKLAIMHHELGETLFVLQREREAEQHYREALRLDRQHTFAPDTLILLGRAIYMRSDSDPGLLDESYNNFSEALAILESPSANEYGTFMGHEKTMCDALLGMGICKSEMPGDIERFQAVEYFERAAKLGLDHPDKITRTELRNIYCSWTDLMQRMGLDREAQLVAERALRNLDS